MLAEALDAGHFRGSVIGFFAARAGRRIEVAGSLRTHILSFNPSITAERVDIGNPPWMPPGSTAKIGRLELVFDLPWKGRPFGIARLAMTEATLDLRRDARGRANWQWRDPAKAAGEGLPLIRSLSMRRARVRLADERRHLQFDGVISAGDTGGTADAAGKGGLTLLRIEGSGRLNGRPATFAINGQALATASHDRPYRFTFAEQSSGSRLSGRGFLSRPFNFKLIDATFDAAGEDLKDLYFLTGVTLLNTGSYQLAGSVTRRGTESTFSNLHVKTGQSDLQGTVAVDSSGARSQLKADLQSALLRTSDLGARAAGREDASKARTLLSDAELRPSAVRRGDASIDFHARRVEMGRIGLTDVAARVSIENGVVVAAPLTGDLLRGRVNARVKIDASTDLPRADFDVKFADLQLGLLARNGAASPPIEGLLRARLSGSGRGSSIHQVAASADGTVSAVLPHGTIRASLAELAGLDLRGLGLMAAKNTQATTVRCAVAAFRAHAGTLTAQTLVMDTDPVLIDGEGTINMDTEGLDLLLRGHPKRVRLLRVRSPLRVRGTLLHPSIVPQAGSAVAQTAEAVALGVILTPLAAVLAFVDPGLAKNADCAELIADAKPGAPVK